MTKYAKLNKTTKKQLVKTIVNNIKEKDDSIKVRSLSKEFNDVIGEDSFKTLSKTNIGKLMKTKPEFKDTVEQLCNEFNDLLIEKPKRKLTAYMKFSISCQKDLKDVEFKERGKQISKSWKNLNDKQKKKFNLTKKELKDYDDSMSKFNNKLNKFMEKII